MYTIYKGRFQSSASTRYYIADVSFGQDHLHVYFEDENGLPHNLDWSESRIRELAHSSAIVSLEYVNGAETQHLDMTDSSFIDTYTTQFRPRARTGIRQYLLRHIVPVTVIGVIGIAIVSWLFLLPVLAGLFAEAFPKDMEISLGQKLYESALQGESVDAERTRQINLFFRQLKVNGDYPVQITVVNQDIANAYALPGGGIVVYDKILKNMRRYDELAALLAHEYSHIQLKHATRNIFRSLSGYLLISVVLGDAGGISAAILQHAEQLRTLQYSRELEHEADANGLAILKTNRVDAAGMERLFRELQREGASEPAELLNSHPDLDSRIGFVKTFLQENTYKPVWNDSMNYYFNRIITP
jgi:Zn-dependent protease with chaperone function